MAKLTQKDRRELRLVLQNLERGRDYLMGDDIVITRKQDRATTTLHYVNKQGEIVYPVHKQAGSDIVGLHRAVNLLGEYLATH